MASYAFLGAFATVAIFGGPLVRLDRAIRGQEATFRRAISRCLERAEPLCLSQGEAAEELKARQCYEELRAQQWARAARPSCLYGSPSLYSSWSSRCGWR